MGETGFAGNWADGLQYCGTIQQQRRLIAFYLFYSTKPELRLMYKSNVTRQALMLHRLLHMWYFSYRVRMARWASLGVGWTSFIDPKQGRNLPQPPTSLHHIHPSIHCLSPLMQHPGLLKPITAPMGRRLGAPWTSGQYVAEPTQRQTAVLSYFYFHFFLRAQFYLPVTAASHLSAIRTDMYWPAVLLWKTACQDSVSWSVLRLAYHLITITYAMLSSYQLLQSCFKIF